MFLGGGAGGRDLCQFSIEFDSFQLITSDFLPVTTLLDNNIMYSHPQKVFWFFKHESLVNDYPCHCPLNTWQCVYIHFKVWDVMYLLDKILR